jgi:hypothetical protein
MFFCTMSVKYTYMIKFGNNTLLKSPHKTNFKIMFDVVLDNLLNISFRTNLHLPKVSAYR